MQCGLLQYIERGNREMDGGMLSQEEINNLLSGGGADSPVEDNSAQDPVDEEQKTILTDEEKDAIGEVANISMGTSATTLYSLVNQKVDITTPVVSIANWHTVVADYEKPCVFIQIQYKVGLDGANILILKENDVKIIADLMMGGDGTNIQDEFGELHLSAISEAMNQMMGSSATSLSSMLGKMIDISPPEATLIDLSDVVDGKKISEFLGGEFVKVTFRMQIGDLVDSSILQLYPIDFAKELLSHFLSGGDSGEEQQQTESQPIPQMDMPMQQPMGMPMQQPMGMPMQQPMGMPMQQPMGGIPMQQPMQNMNIQPAQFQNFASNINPMQSQENIGLIMDVPLEVTVELGRTSKLISEILDFAPGTIIELDKIAGEPIDVLVNGKFVAKGEVVVIEESFGVRVTEIIK